MALGDITVYRHASSNGGAASLPFVAAASAGVIQAGEPVYLVAGASAVLPNQSNNLVLVTSPFVPLSVTGTGILGIAETTATNTATVAGEVYVIPANTDSVYIINAKTSASVATQALYDALVGKRVLMDLTSGVYTLLTTDSALNGFVIQPLNIFKYPNKIAFTIRAGVTAQQ